MSPPTQNPLVDRADRRRSNSPRRWPVGGQVDHPGGGRLAAVRRTSRHVRRRIRPSGATSTTTDGPRWRRRSGVAGAGSEPQVLRRTLGLPHFNELSRVPYVTAQTGGALQDDSIIAVVRPIKVDKRPIALRVPIDGGFLVTRGEHHRPTVLFAGGVLAPDHELPVRQRTLCVRSPPPEPHNPTVAPNPHRRATPPEPLITVTPRRCQRTGVSASRAPPSWRTLPARPRALKRATRRRS